MGFLTSTPGRARRPRGRAPWVLALVLVAACGPASESPKLSAAPGEWLEFTGSWNAAGSRQSISLGAGRTASVVDLKGTLLLAGPNRPGVGFQAEVIGLVDSATGFTGRSIWTDEKGHITRWDWFVDSAEWKSLLALIGLEPDGLTSQEYTINFLREGGVGA